MWLELNGKILKWNYKFGEPRLIKIKLSDGYDDRGRWYPLGAELYET